MKKIRFLIRQQRAAGLAMLIFLIFASYGLQAKYVLITDPKPTHFEKNPLELETVKMIGEEIDDENFFAQPRWVTPDDQGNFFVYDGILLKVLKHSCLSPFFTRFLSEDSKY